ncbi:hypothetical protein [Pseudooceanicola algae]|uniref:Uncharacterized protein n=1 Tax=Pseudooceanicola algae TaxID=1537215 RepID=A0A418SJV0_9RHOB|nr:hypothetical protein [Pseudooceanicola algae]QPM90674.1 hypothetical protein PSAL_019130 [Pseudooceanicola algae]
MTQQLLLRYDTFDPAAHDAGAESRAAAGLTQLQLWREGAGSHWALFSLSDTARAKAWLATSGSLGQAPCEHHLLETL